MHHVPLEAVFDTLHMYEFLAFVALPLFLLLLLSSVVPAWWRRPDTK